jgi:hypothetical protein
MIKKISFEKAEKYPKLKKEQLKVGTTVICENSSLDFCMHIEKIISIDNDYHFSTRIANSCEHHIEDCLFYCL